MENQPTPEQIREFKKTFVEGWGGALDLAQSFLNLINEAPEMHLGQPEVKKGTATLVEVLKVLGIYIKMMIQDEDLEKLIEEKIGQ